MTFVAVALNEVDKTKVVPVTRVKIVADEVNENPIESEYVALSQGVWDVARESGGVVNENTVKWARLLFRESN
jgi:hypothetical protein